MKKLLLVAVSMFFILPVCAEEFSVQGAEASKFFNSSRDSRFQYELPSAVNFPLKRDSKQKVKADDDEITLDETDVKPVKKVIKRIENTPADGELPVNSKDVPMNYDSFPKFYDNNNMMQQQFMPMF